MRPRYLDKPTAADRERSRRLSEHFARENSRRLQREREENWALLTEAQKALIPEVDFGFVDDES